MTPEMKAEFDDYAKWAEAEIAQIIRDLCMIPAPSHQEKKRAEYCRNWFNKNKFTNVSIDDAYNVIVPVNLKPDQKYMVMMAHTDTVFPDTEPLPFLEKNGYMYSPGITDDTANLAVMMVCARYFKDHFPADSNGILFVANSCEEGLGNLKGCRQIMEKYGNQIDEFVTLDSACLNKIVTHAVGSHRYQVEVKTQGGHSFNNFGNKNAIHAISEIITELYKIQVPQEGNSKTTYNVGTISGGTSVNTIAQDAVMLYEYRSDNLNCLKTMQERSAAVFDSFRNQGITLNIKKIGDRPCSAEIDPERFGKLIDRIKNAMAETHQETPFETSGSTDCNIPLSMGIPAICFGVCRGSGAHTREEHLEISSLYDGCRLLLNFLYR